MGPRKLWPDPQTDTFAFEKGLQRQGYEVVAGLDEVGRGPLAGPVVAACVVLPATCAYHRYVDSKIITPAARHCLARELQGIGAMIGIGVVGEDEIDRINILQASLAAMKKSIESLGRRPDFLLVDGKFPVPVPIPQQTLIRGESKSASIAAASIVAKVFRDALMEKYHQRFPVYNFRDNKGYATKEHRQAIKKHGPCAIHRLSFKGLRDYADRPIHGRRHEGKEETLFPFS